MSDGGDMLGDVYRQLALLTRAQLPLPGALAELAGELRSRRLRATFEALAQDVSDGKTLGDALEEHGQALPAVHRRLLGVCESGDVLSDTLFEVARLADVEHSLGQRLREAVATPALTVAFALALSLGLARYVLCDFGVHARELFHPHPLPAAAEFVFRTAEGISSAWIPLVVLYCLVFAVFVWAVFGSGFARLRHGLLRWVPGCGRVMRHLDLARTCAVLGLCLGRGLALERALQLCADLCLDTRLGRSLATAAEACEAGRSLEDALGTADALPDGMRLVMLQSPESELSDELGKMADVWTERSGQTARWVATCWQGIAFGSMALACAVMMILLFQPLVQLLREGVMGGIE